MAKSAYGKPNEKKPVRRKKTTKKTTEETDRTTVTVDENVRKKRSERSDSNKRTQQSKSGVKLALAKGFVDQTLEIGVKGLTAEFRARKRIINPELMTEFVAQQAANKNRYKDVGCLDATRVRLTLGPVEYIHANYVSTPSNPKKFICTQAPMTKTCAEFWCMIVQEKSAVILMLCNLIERGANKCAKYFPGAEGETVTFGDVTVFAKKQSKFPFTNMRTSVKIKFTEMEVTIKGEGTHTCSHYHWLDWPDRGVPEADMAPIVLLNSLSDNGKPIVVHCSAGIGRTGSIVLLQHVLELLKDNVPVEPIVGYMDELRKQRHNSVQTEHQYLYVHQVLLIYMKKTGYLEETKEMKKKLEVFTKDYEKATSAFNKE